MVHSVRAAAALLVSGALTAGTLASAPAQAQGDYPTKPVLLVISFAAGGGLDVWAVSSPTA